MPSSRDNLIVFDLDDTLYLERDFVFSGFSAVGDWVAARHGIVNFSGVCRTLFQAGHRRFIFDEALAQCRLTNRQHVAELVKIYRDHKPEISLCPDAARYLQRGNDGFGMITDGPERTQRHKIAALGLGPYFETIIPTGQWPNGFGKPHPRAYEELAARANGRRCVYIADNAAKDFVTPNRMGWLTVQIMRPARVHPGDAPDQAHAAQVKIQSLDQLDEVLTTF